MLPRSPGSRPGLSLGLYISSSTVAPRRSRDLLRPFNLCGAADRARVREQQPLAVASISFARDRAPSAQSGGSSIRLDLRHASKTILSDPQLQFNTPDRRRAALLECRERGGDRARFYGGAVVGNRISLRSRTEAAVRNVSDYVPPQSGSTPAGELGARFRFNELGRSSTSSTVPRGHRDERRDLLSRRLDRRRRDGARCPPGGNTLMVANLEARLPSPFLSELLRYAVFVDAGRVWNRDRTSTVAGGFRQVRITPGGGIRVASPVGPIRVDVGYNPYKRSPGVAYNAFRGSDNDVAPLYCVSPDNTRPVDTSKDPPEERDRRRAGQPCNTQVVPSQRRAG